MPQEPAEESVGPLPRHVVVMGVSGNGKSTTGTWLADELDRIFLEGDDFHPPENIEKMTSGTPLTDEDRRPWLRAVAEEIARLETADQQSVIGCSSLRRVYRDWLRQGYAGLYFLHLHAAYEVLEGRMKRRRKHFMPASLLRSQFETLEPLEPDELGSQVSVLAPPDQVVSAALAALRGAANGPTPG